MSTQTYSIPTPNIQLAMKTLEKKRPNYELFDNFPIFDDADLRLQVHKFVYVQKDVSSHELDSFWSMCRLKLSDLLFNRFAEFPSRYETFDFTICIDVESFDAKFVAKPIRGNHVSKRRKFEDQLSKLINKLRERLLVLADHDKKTLWNLSVTLIVTRELHLDKHVFYLN